MLMKNMSVSPSARESRSAVSALIPRLPWTISLIRLREALGYRTPAEYEAALTGASHTASQPAPALATE